MLLWSFIIRATPVKQIAVGMGCIVIVCGSILMYSNNDIVAQNSFVKLIDWIK